MGFGLSVFTEVSIDFKYKQKINNSFENIVINISEDIISDINSSKNLSKNLSQDLISNIKTKELFDIVNYYGQDAKKNHKLKSHQNFDSNQNLLLYVIGKLLLIISSDSDNLFNIADQISGISQININIKSQVPIGSGFGSSAAVLAALVKAFNKAFDMEWDLAKMFGLVHEFENLVHGKSSGFDPALALTGGIVFAKSSDLEDINNLGDLSDLEDINVLKRAQKPESNKSNLLNNLFFINTGKPVGSTKESVKYVQDNFGDNSGDVFNWDNWGKCTEKLFNSLKNNDAKTFAEQIRANHKLLCEIGVVPKQVQDFIKKCERLGLAAKISGAGSVEGDCAGLVIVFVSASSDLEYQNKIEQLNVLVSKFSYVNIYTD